MIYKGVIVYIDPAHRSSGLFHCMIDYNLNFPEIAEVSLFDTVSTRTSKYS